MYNGMIFLKNRATSPPLQFWILSSFNNGPDIILCKVSPPGYLQFLDPSRHNLTLILVFRPFVFL